MSEITPVAVIGAGHMGKHHVRIYSQMPAVRLVAVVDADIERAKALAEPLGAAWAAQIDQFADKVAAVSIAVPTNKHLEVSRPLIERGIATLIEKPLAPTTDQAERIVELARRHRAIVQVGHTERFNPAVQAVERLDIRPKFVETHRISPFTFRSADIGVVFDMMIHDIDILLNLVRDEVAHVDAVGVNVLGPHEDIANARVTFRRGAVANLTASRLALKTERKLRVFCETAYVSLDYQKKVGVAVTRDKNLDIMRLARERDLDDLSQLAGLDFGKMVNVQPLVIHDTDALSRELEVFIDCVRNQAPPPVSAEDGLAAVRLASRIVESLSAHRWDGDQSGRVGLTADIFSVAEDASEKSR
jgi:predicted dehydrogenase